MTAGRFDLEALATAWQYRSKRRTKGKAWGVAWRRWSLLLVKEGQPVDNDAELEAFAAKVANDPEVQAWAEQQRQMRAWARDHPHLRGDDS